jgi:hypothetical protein
MTIEQRVLDAFDDLDGLLLDGAKVEDALIEAAMENRLRPDVLKIRAEAQFGNLDVHRENLRRASEWRAQELLEQRAFTLRQERVREEAATVAKSVYYACLLDDPVRAGRPSWSYCLEGLVRRLELTDDRLKKAARESLYDAIKRLDRKHGTSTTHF